MIDSHQFIDADALFKRMQVGEPALLIDVREPAEYRDDRAENAVSIPLGSISKERVQAHRPQWNAASEPVYLICESGLRALQAAEQLHREGVCHPVVVNGGAEAWRDAQLPTTGDAGALSLQRQTQIALGVLLLLITAKGLFLHPYFYLLVGLVASGLLLAGFTARCTLTGLLARMPWNRQPITVA